MKKKTYLFLATGFEETEAVGTIDILRRGGVDVTTVSITDKRIVTGAHGIPIEADALFDDISFVDAHVLILPGGGPGSQMLNKHTALKQLIVQHAEQNKHLAAICAAPLVFGGLGLLKGKRATCYPGIEPLLTDAILATEQPTVTDGNITTGKGPGLVFDFGLEILAQLAGKNAADSVAADLLR